MSAPRPPSEPHALRWCIRLVVRLAITLGMYLLGVIAVCSIQASRSAFSILSLVTLLVLPFGVEDGLFQVFPTLRTLVSNNTYADLLSPLIGPVLMLTLMVVIVLARSRWMLILSYLGFLIVILLAVKGCSGPMLSI